MKNIVLVIINAILGVLTLMIVMTVYGRMNRSMELQSNLSSVVETTVDNMVLSNKYSIQNTNEFLADLVSELSVLLDCESDITINVLQCDKERGILSVEVVLAYAHPNGKEGTVSCEKTVIVNRLPAALEPDKYKVAFWVGVDLYKEYLVEAESVISTPAEPQSAEGMFCGWIDENGYPVDFAQPITKNTVYFADMR